MRRSSRGFVAAGFVAGMLFLSGQAQACEQCQQKLRCIGDDCWLEYVCVGNLRFPQRGWSSCEYFSWGCSYQGELCLWAQLQQPGLPFMAQTPVCTAS